MFENERHFARTDFQNGAGAESAGDRHSRNPGRRSRHSARGIRRPADRTAPFRRRSPAAPARPRSRPGCRTRPGSRIRLRVGSRRDRLPEIGDVIGGAAFDLDHGGVALGAITDNRRLSSARSRKVDADRNALSHHRLGAIDQPLARVQRAQALRRRARRRRGESGFAKAANLRAPAREMSSG